jgi:hypothetical protein
MMEIAMDRDRQSKQQLPTAFIYDPFRTQPVRLETNRAHLPYFKAEALGCRSSIEKGRLSSAKDDSGAE